jgi:osmoprotectant transport system substrate-binding protein
MTRSRWRAPLALTLALGLAISVAACGNDDSSTSTAATTTIAGPTIRLAPQDFAESKTLTEVYGQYLKAQGFTVTIQQADGFRSQAYPDLEANKFDLLIDYTGSAARFLDSTKTVSSDAAATAATLDAVLQAKDLVAFTYSKAADANALVALKTFAETNKLTTISDLSKVSGTIKLGGAEDCRERADCLKGYTDPAIYGLKIDFTAVEYGPALVAALDAGTEQVVQYQTTAAELASGKYVILKDDKGILSADNVVPVLRKALADAYGSKLSDAVDALSAKLTTADLIAWNKATDINKEEPADVAKAWLTDKGLL